MQSNTLWFMAGGPLLARLIDTQREPICQAVTIRLEQMYPALCYNYLRPDAVTFQRSAFARSPQRLHALVQAALQFRTVGLIDREYRWFWNLGPRFGVDQEHMLSMHHWYFETVREFVSLAPADRAALSAFEETVMEILLHVTSQPSQAAEPLRRSA